MSFQYILELLFKANIHLQILFYSTMTFIPNIEFWTLFLTDYKIRYVCHYLYRLAFWKKPNAENEVQERSFLATAYY